MNDFLAALKESGVKGDPQLLLNGIRFWNPYTRRELKIYFNEDTKMISFMAGSESGIFPYSINPDDWPDSFIELLDITTRVI